MNRYLTKKIRFKIIQLELNDVLMFYKAKLCLDIIKCLSFFFLFTKVEKYSNLLKKLLVKTEEGLLLLPELFYVPLDKVCTIPINLIKV